jgi:hypothetical protein
LQRNERPAWPRQRNVPNRAVKNYDFDVLVNFEQGDDLV